MEMKQIVVKMQRQMGIILETQVSNRDDIEGSRNTFSNITHEEDVNLHTRRETITPSWMRDYISRGKLWMLKYSQFRGMKHEV